MFSYPAILVLVALRALIAIQLLFEISRGNAPFTLVIPLAITGLLVHMRNQYSNNGSDQLATIILISASIGFLPSTNNLVFYLSITFIACQSALSYATSGLLKLIAMDWRNGNALKDILHTSTFGHPVIYRLLDQYSLAHKVISLGVIFLEICLGLCILFPPSIAAYLLLGGIILHGVIAFTMGLNNFFLTFPATYPCLYFLCFALHTHA